MPASDRVAASIGQVADYRHGQATRRNIPPAGLAPQGRISQQPAWHYSYDPHLAPRLHYDHSSAADRALELLEYAQQRSLNQDELKDLAALLSAQQPWLEWAGKREQEEILVDPVSLHIHERVAAKAILKAAMRLDIQRSLFADPELEYRKAVQFYQHDIHWANRLILGDSLAVMSSLARREALAGKIQMIYLDPPYGIRFSSNFQPMVNQRDVKDRPQDLTREVEMIKAYRDTWTLGIHSYLRYLRDRLTVARELLSDEGSIFVQISDENVHLVRCLLDEVFGSSNFGALITFRVKSPLGVRGLGRLSDYILWYMKDSDQAKYRQLYVPKSVDEQTEFNMLELSNGARLTRAEASRISMDAPEEPQITFTAQNLASSGYTPSCTFEFPLEDRLFPPPRGRSWKTNESGMMRLASAGRLHPLATSLRYVYRFEDFPVQEISNLWTDTFAESDKSYVVQTSSKVISRCMLMTTDPGDLVLDPTCGSGTTAFVAEQWGRRWITIDTSRVAVAIARQRLLTSTYDYFALQEDSVGPASGFRYRKVAHITLKSIAQNVALDPIFAKHATILDEKLTALNTALISVTGDGRSQLASKLMQKERTEGKRTILDADRRRWILPRDGWKHWEVPFDIDPDWPTSLQTALSAYRSAWRAKMDEVDAAIAANAEQEELFDQPEVVRNTIRVSGPFTVESVLPVEERLEVEPDSSVVAPWDQELAAFDEGDESSRHAAESRARYSAGLDGESQNADAYLDKMTRLLRADGARFFDNKRVNFTRLDQISADVLHAEGEWEIDGGTARSVVVSFGPQHGDVTAKQVEDGLWLASRRGFEDIVFAGFSFDAASQAAVQDDPNPRVRAHLAQIRPDVNMGSLLKQTPSSQIFTILGLPRTHVSRKSDGQWTVTMEGVDIYDPVENVVRSAGAEKVAAWFLDSDYDGRTFCICQAFFPDKNSWQKIARALKGVIDPDAFAAFTGTTSLPFSSGLHSRAAVKVIDPRGNEVMSVHTLALGVSSA